MSRVVAEFLYPPHKYGEFWTIQNELSLYFAFNADQTHGEHEGAD
jgi:hypothetical protein